MKYTRKWMVVPYNSMCEPKKISPILANKALSADEKVKFYNNNLVKDLEKTKKEPEDFIEQQETSPPLQPFHPTLIKEENDNQETSIPTVKKETKAKDKKKTPNKKRVAKRKLNQSLLNSSITIKRKKKTQDKHNDELFMDISEEEEEVPRPNTRYAVKQKHKEEYENHLQNAYKQMQEGQDVTNLVKNWTTFNP